MKKVEMTKAELTLVKNLIKFTSKKRDKYSHIIYNSKRQRFEATDGWAAVVIEYPIADLGELKYIVELTTDAVILGDDANWFPVLDWVLPDEANRAKKMTCVDGFGLGRRPDRNDKSISSFLGRIDLCLNFRYLLNLPRTDYKFYQQNEKPEEHAGLLIGEAELCRIQAIIMPIKANNN